MYLSLYVIFNEQEFSYIKLPSSLHSISKSFPSPILVQLPLVATHINSVYNTYHAPKHYDPIPSYPTTLSPLYILMFDTHVYSIFSTPITSYSIPCNVTLSLPHMFPYTYQRYKFSSFYNH